MDSYSKLYEMDSQFGLVDLEKPEYKVCCLKKMTFFCWQK